MPNYDFLQAIHKINEVWLSACKDKQLGQWSGLVIWSDTFLAIDPFGVQVQTSQALLRIGWDSES